MKQLCYTSNSFRFLERGWTEKPIICPRCKGRGWITGIERPCKECNPGGEWRSTKTSSERYTMEFAKDLADSVVVGNKMSEILRLNRSSAVSPETLLQNIFSPKEGDLFSVPEGYRVETGEQPMNLYADKGSKVMVSKTSINNGYKSDKDHAAKYLKVGGTYTVNYTVVHDWYTDVFLEEFPDTWFNSVFFVVQTVYLVPLEQPGKEESQEDLWREVEEELSKTFPSWPTIKRNFSITRKI